MQSLNEDLAKLERDVQAVFKDTDRLVGDVKERARTVEEELVAAEFIATEETIEGISGILETLSEIRAIQNEQVKIFFADHRDTLKALTQLRSPADVLRLGFEHWNRRATHVTEGFTKTVDVIAREGNVLSTSMKEMWKPFVDMIRGDWARR
jgi:hypothetical protein